MSKIEILSKSITLRQTLSEAIDYIKQNIDSDIRMENILTDLKNAVHSVEANLSSFIDEKSRREFQQQTARLQNSCDALRKSKTAANAFFDSFTAWERMSSHLLYTEAILSAQNSTANEEAQSIELLELVLSGCMIPELKSLACYLLSRMLSQTQPQRSYDLCIEAFELNNRLCSIIIKHDLPIHNYVYNRVEEIHFDKCPVCHGEGSPYYCAMPLYMLNYTPLFSPVKLWMKCSSCGQLYAYNFPRKMIQTEPDKEEVGDEIYMQSIPQNLPAFGDIISRILYFSAGKRLLEVGAGTGELIAAALEFGCDVEAVEISKRQSQRIAELLEIPVHCMDFLKYETEKKYDMITMGDVIEHVTDPARAIKKAHALLDHKGILWIATPNFESGFSRIMRFADPMWKEPWHITYFSYTGFKNLLCENGFKILDYKISSRYNGSMEIMAVKA